MTRMVRRDFLTAGAGALLGSSASLAAGEKSRVVLAKNEKVFADARRLKPAATQELVDKAVARLVGEQDATAAWKALIRPADVVGIKEFGVGLTFTPTVLDAGRISLKIATEVSELSNAGAFTLGSVTSATLTVPGLKVRRANTTVELSSGGSLVMAGLIQENTKQSLNGLPGAKDIPILGALFRSRDYQNEETELVVIVTPYIVRQVARDKLARPDEGFVPPNDAEAVLLGRLNAIYGMKAPQERIGRYRGGYGFIME